MQYLNLYLGLLGFFGFIALIIKIAFSMSRFTRKNHAPAAVPANAAAPAPARQKTPYRLKPNVLTQHELKLYTDLLPVTHGTNLIILPKIRIADFICCPNGTRNYYSWFNKISAKHVDFLICDKMFRPLLAIELDDRSHDRSAGIERDRFVDAVYSDAGLAVLHLRGYEKEMLKERVFGIIYPEEKAAG